MLDARTGRWYSPDPVKKHWESPYAGFANNPVYFVDPSGLDPTNGNGTPTCDEKKGGNPKSGGREGDKVTVGSHKEEDCENCYNGQVVDYVLTKGDGGSPGTSANSGNGQKKGTYVKGGYNDSPYKINLSQNTSRLAGPAYNNHWENTFLEVMEGFSKRMASNMSLGATSLAAPVYDDDDNAQTRRNKAVGAILADILSIELGTGEMIGGGLGELVTFGLGSAVFLPMIAHGAGVVVTSGIALYTDVQMLFTVDAVVSDGYHGGSDEDENDYKYDDYKVKKKDKFRGGKQKDRDRSIKQFPKEFQRWYHKFYKEGGKDATDEELKEIYDEWIRQGKPTIK